eukprot:CAMPEP_0170481812 /NCGR_PEP_ID=MMETSP0208-20121228/2110_1 /TAXON_ID=197538 /ORGANISM="Strombidium inclinatum, Strain S3" /LENGTH=66 /DNA_ID=CAMNT_0010754583 /DNA_START=182 /DNA_END=382 /DNA_ORIENTATION=-
MAVTSLLILVCVMSLVGGEKKKIQANQRYMQELESRGGQIVVQPGDILNAANQMAQSNMAMMNQMH